MTAEQMIKEYKNLKLELSVTEFQLRHFEGISETDMMESMLYSHPEGERVQTGTLSDKTANIAMNYKRAMARENDGWYNFLLHRYSFLKEELEFFDTAVDRLCGKYADIVRDMLDEDVTWDQMEVKYHVSRMMISKYRKKALSMLQKEYDLRDKVMESYILG